MSPCPVPYSHFCRVRRRASTQLFFGNTLLAARLFAGSSRAKSGFPRRGKLTWQACSTILVSSLSHDASKATSERALVALVSLSDLLCRMGGLGYGYTEDRQVNFLEQPGFHILEKECPKLDSFDWARFTFELEAYLDEVHQLVNLLYRGPK